MPCGRGAAAGRFGPVEIGEGWFSAPREISRGIPAGGEAPEMGGGSGADEFKFKLE